MRTRTHTLTFTQTVVIRLDMELVNLEAITSDIIHTVGKVINLGDSPREPWNSILVMILVCQ